MEAGGRETRKGSLQWSSKQETISSCLQAVILADSAAQKHRNVERQVCSCGSDRLFCTMPGITIVNPGSLQRPSWWWHGSFIKAFPTQLKSTLSAWTLFIFGNTQINVRVAAGEVTMTTRSQWLIGSEALSPPTHPPHTQPYLVKSLTLRTAAFGVPWVGARTRGLPILLMAPQKPSVLCLKG